MQMEVLLVFLKEQVVLKYLKKRNNSIFWKTLSFLFLFDNYYIQDFIINTTFNLPYLFLIKFSVYYSIFIINLNNLAPMRCRNRTKKMDLSYSQDDFEVQQDSLNEDYVQKKRAQKAQKKAPRRGRGAQKRNKKVAQQSQDSINQSQQILEFKHNDDQVKEHYRPSFIQRWNGIDNQIEILSSQYEQMSPMFKVYWQTKSKNMNAIIFLQFGRMEFFAFQNDAIILHEMFKKKLKHFSAFLMVNFWYKQIVLIKQTLFDQGIPVLMMNQINDPVYRMNNNLIRRQIDQVLTPGIHLDMEDKAYKERWFMAFYIQDNKQVTSRKIRSIAEQKQQSQNKLKKACVILLDSQSNKFYIEQFEVDEKMHEVRRVINRYRPVELLLIKNSSQYVKNIKIMARQICNPYIVQIGYERQEEKVNQTLQKFIKHSTAPLFKQLLSLCVSKKCFDKKFQMFSTVKCLDLIYEYLSNLKLKQKIFDEGLFQISCFNQMKLKPFFDSQVYQNLQIFRIKNQDQGQGKKGTLIAYVDKCMTNSGKKLLRKWINQPLVTLQAISQRQQCIRQIVQNQKYSSIITFHQKLIAYQKLQKQVADVYHWVVKGYDKNFHKLTGDLTFEKGYDQKKNPAVVRIKQILKILNLLKQFQQYLNQIKKFNLKSKYFRRFTHMKPITLKSANKIQKGQEKLDDIPEINKIIQSITQKIDYNEPMDFLQPSAGVSQKYDDQKRQKIKIQQQLEKELIKWKTHFKNNKLTYTNVRARNQIQVPKSCFKSRKQLPKQLIFSSQTASMQRFTTAVTIQLSEQLMIHQHRIARIYQPFMHDIIDEFCKFKFIWNKYIEAISQIDVIMSIAQTSKQMVPRCIPKFVLDDQNSFLQIRKAFHPGLVQVLDQQQLVSNNLSLKKRQRFLLLTGPNMGGKSTLLRQTCLLAILAQIGCCVPCQYYESIVFDQIFCRIGSSDRIIQGKSTFYVQLEQTNRILKQATSSSLVIIDELGRGTSTYDGMAIAEATVKYILENIGCYTLFSTHYTPITQDFLSNEQVRCCKMSYKLVQKQKQNKLEKYYGQEINQNQQKKQHRTKQSHKKQKKEKSLNKIGQTGLKNTAVEKDKKINTQQRLQFLYQVQTGIAQKSFANNVARMVGLPKQILQQADQKAEWIAQLHREAEVKWQKMRNLNQLVECGIIPKRKKDIQI